MTAPHRKQENEYPKLERRSRDPDGIKFHVRIGFTARTYPGATKLVLVEKKLQLLVDA